MPRLERFDENSEARDFHARGLRESKAGQFMAAHDLFAEAIEIVEARTQPHDPSREMQVSRITADDGFTHVREAARMMTAATVMDQAVIVPPIVVYRAAAKELLKGTNLYYLVSNYNHAAIQRALEGNLATAGSWIDKSEQAIGSAHPNDPNLKAAQRDLRLRRPAASTKRRARNSVFRAP